MEPLPSIFEDFFSEGLIDLFLVSIIAAFTLFGYTFVIIEAIV
jgi:hypothetical protein